MAGETLEQLPVGVGARVLGVVHEGDAARMVLVEERPQHREHRRDSAAPADQHQMVRAGLREHELARRLAQTEHQAPACGGVEVAGDEPVGVCADRQLEVPAATVLGAGGRVAAGVAAAVDLDRDGDELPGPEAAPVAVPP